MRSNVAADDSSQVPMARARGTNEPPLERPAVLAASGDCVDADNVALLSGSFRCEAYQTGPGSR